MRQVEIAARKLSFDHTDSRFARRAQ